MKYPKNRFKIHLPSLAAAEKEEKRKARGILKHASPEKHLDSAQRRALKGKISDYKENRELVRKKIQNTPSPLKHGKHLIDGVGFRFGSRSRNKIAKSLQDKKNRFVSAEELH